MSYQFTVTGQQTGTANTQLQFNINILDIETLNLILESVGGVFASQNATVDVSHDGTTFHAVDSLGLGTGNKVGKFYDKSARGATISLDVISFPIVRITIPALGVGISAKVTWSGSKRHY